MRPSIAVIGAVFTNCTSYAGRARARQLNCLACHVGFRQPAALGDSFQHMTVAIAGGKIHPAVSSAGILTQHAVDDAHGLDELAPVGRPEKSETADAVAYRNLIGGLLLVFRLHQLLDR